MCPLLQNLDERSLRIGGGWFNFWVGLCEGGLIFGWGGGTVQKASASSLSFESAFHPNRSKARKRLYTSEAIIRHHCLVLLSNMGEHIWRVD